MIALINRIFIATIQILCNWVTKLSSFANSYKSFSLSNCLAASGAALPQQDNKVSKRHIGLFFAWWLGWAFVTACGLGVASNAYAVQAEDGTNHFAYISSGYCRFGSSHSNSIYGNANKFGRLGYDGATSDNGRGYQEGIKDFFSSNGNHRSWVAGIFKDTDGYCWVCEYDSDQNEYWNVYEATDIRYADACVNVIKQTVTSFSTEAVRKIYPSRALSESRFLSIPGARSINVNVSEMSSLYSGESIQILDQIGNVLEPQRSYDWDTGDENFTVLDDTIIVRFSSGENDSGIYDGNGNVKISKNVIPEAVGPMTLSASSNDQDLTWKITDSSGTTIAEGNSSYEGDDWSGYNYIEETIDLPIDISYIFTINSGGDCCYTFDLKDAEGTVIASGKKLGSNESAMFDISSTVLIINGYPTRTVYETLDYSFTPQVFGSNGSSLTFSIKNKPTWATFNSSTGALTGTPTSGDVGETSGIEITVSNDNGTATLAAFDITVLPPVAGMSPVYFYFWEGSADWKIIDSSGTIVAQGDLDSDSIELLVGTYTLTVDSCDYCEYSIEDDEANGLAWGDDDGSVLFKITSIFITGSPATTIYENQAYNFTPKVLNNSDNSLTFSIKNKPTWAPFDSNTGALTGTPTNSDIGTTSAIEITVSNGIETATLAAFDITVAVNTPPTFTSTAITSVDEDSTYTYEITTNDVDVGNNLTITAETKPTWLTFTDNGDTTATLTDTPTNSEVGSYNVTLRVNDGTEDVDQSFTIVVANVNDPPVITQGASTSVAISKNNTPTAFSLTLDATDIDPTSDTITWNISDPANYGTANVTGTGTPKAITYTPNPNNTTSDSFIVQVSDSNGGTDTITVNVTFTNEPPVITEGITKTVTMSEDDNLNFTLNTTDPNGINEMLTWSISSAASNGTASASGTGVSKSINYNPDANYNGSDSFVVEVSDGSLTDTITVKVTIEPANDSPSITEGPTVSVTILEDSTPSEILNATDIDNDNNLLSWNISTQANHGTASASGTGASKSISYNPAADYNGSDSFVVEVSDGSLTDTITINVTITNVNDPPVITQGVSTSVTISKNNIPTAFSLTLDATDIDPTNDTITWSISNPASRGTANVSGIGATKAITYTSTNVNDMTSDSFDVQVSDGNGATDTITVNVTFTNAPPVITEGDAKTIAISEDSNPIPFSLTLNATDPNGTNDTLSWSISSVASNGAASLIDNGASTIVNYIPTLNFIGEDNFEVKVTDTSGATDTFAVTVNVNEPNSINTPPVASDGSFTINEDGGSLTNLLIATDADGNSLTYSKVSDPSHGTVTISNATGSFTYTPTTDFNGSDSFKFKVNDGTVDSNIATVTISVTPIADMPTITPATTNEDIQTTSGLKISRHVDDGIEVTHFKITHIQYGTLYKNDGTTIIKINNGDFITVAEGNAGLKFTPIPDASTDGSFDVQSSKTDDDNGLGGNIATATITVSSVNDKPSFTASNPPPITEDAGAQSVTNWISSFNPGPSNESDQTVDSYIVESVSDSSLFSADAGPAIDSSGTLTYTPATNAFGTSTFTVKVKDNGGTTDDSGIDNGGIDTSDSQTFTITINTIADVPSVTTGTTTNEDIQSSDLVIIAASGDTDVSHFKITNIVGGKLYKNDGSTAINNSNFITKDEGNAGLKFTPALNSITGGSFGIQSSTTNNDSGLGGNVITATITVNPVNDKPSFTASNPPPITEDAGAQSVTNWISSFNPGPSNESDQTVDSYIVESVSDSSLFSADAGPAIDSSGTLTYTPAANAFGTSTFTVKVKDNGGTTDDSGIDNGGIDTSDAQTFTITVNTIADVPSVTTGTTTNEDTQSSDLVITAASGDTDVTHFKITNIVGGTLYKNDGSTAINNSNFITKDEGNAGLKFTPALNSITGGSFGIQSSTTNNDSGLGGNVITATITVNPINDKPSFTASNPPPITEDAGAQSVTWISSFNPGPSNESDQTVDSYIIESVSDSSLFSADAGPTIDSSGTLTYTPAANAFGTSTFTVKVKDNGGTTDDSGIDNGGIDTSDSQTFTITINTIADVPSVTTGTTTNEDTQSSDLVITAASGDTNVTHFKITNIVGGTLYKNDGTTAISNGNFITEAEGNAGLKFTPALNSITAGSFGIQASIANNDSGLGGSVMTANITVNPVNDKPSFTASNPPAVIEDAGAQTVTGWISSFNRGPSNESGQAVFAYIIDNVSNSDLFSAGPAIDNSGNLTYTPAPNAFGTSTFEVKVQDDGGTDNGGVDTSDFQRFTITVNTVADVPSVTNATTNEDTQSDTGLVITNNGDTDVTYFKITNIVGGILYKNDGNTAISNGNFISEAEGNAGLKFTPALNSIAGGSFGVQSSTANDNRSLGGNVITANITVNPVNDKPTFTASNPPAVNEDAEVQTISNWITSFNTGPSNENSQAVSDYLIANISNPDLFAIAPDVDNSGTLTYTVAANTFGVSDFRVKVKDDGGTANSGIDTSDAQTFTITVNTIADVPSVTNATTNEDTQSDSGLVITDNGDTSVTHFKITNIVGGILYQNDGSTAINNGDFITEAEGNAGLKFTPATDANIGGSFDVQSSLADDNNGLGGNTITATITVNPVNDQPNFTASNPPAITEDAGAQTVTGWISSFNPGPANESGQIVSTYIINNISNASLFSGGPIIDNSGNLTYTPVSDAFGSSTFDVKVQDNGGTANGGIDTSDAQTFTITLNTMADVPNVTNATTNEDTQSNSGLVITDNGDIDVTHFKITNIVGGTLYKNDGSTAINNGDFITEASGNAGLKFTPATDANLGGSFGIQSSVTNDNSGLGGNVVTATISVNPVNDIPSFTASNPSMIVENAGPQTITGWITSFNQGGNESNQVVNAYIVTNVNAPTLFSAAPSVDNFGNLTYTPATNTSGSSTFEVKVQDTGGTANGGVDTSIAKIFTITVTPKSVITPEPVTTPEPVITPEPVTTSPTGVSATSETGILQFALTTYFASERDGELQTITVTRTEKSKGNVSIQYFASANGTAISEVDYIGGIGTLTWANGDIQPKVLPLTILVDDETESLETVNLTLFNPTGHATLGSLAQTTLIIVDDDTYVPENSPTAVNSTTTATSNAGTLQFSAPFYSAIEDIGIVTTLNVIRTGGSEGEVSVQYTILDNGTAAFNFDYIGGAGKLIWVDGDSSAKSIVVMLLDDQQLEDVKTIPLILTEPTGGASLGVPDRATLVVVDNDGQPEVPPQVESEFTPSPEEPTSDSSLDKGKVTISPSPDESEDDSEYTNTSSLPSLGRGIAVAKDGDMLNAKVLEDMTGITIAFRGGASVGGSQAYHSNITTTPSHKVKIRGEIDIANTHIGQKADILVLVGVLDDVSGTVQFLMLDKAQLQVWDGGFATLVGSEVVLSKTQKLKIYHGFIEPVHVQIYFGYRLQKNGSIYFNGEQPIELQVGSEDDSSQDQKNQQVVWHTEFSPNGEQIVIASSTGHVSLWDANSGHRLAKFTAHTEKVKSAVFSADSKWLVTSSHDKTARLWNIETKQEVMVFSGHERALEYATFSPNAQRILTVSADKTARLWDTNNGETLFILEGHNQGVQYATFSHDGKRIVTASWDHTARLWDAETGEEIARLAGHANMVERAVFSPNDQYIITASWDKTARLWDAHTGQEILALAGHRNGVAYAAFSPDAEYIVTTSWDNTVRLWSARNGKSLWVREHQAGVHHAAFSPNSQIIVTGSNDGTARLWESATGRPIKTLKGHEGNVWQVGFSPDGKQVISASWDNTVRVWEVETGNIVMVLKD